jgi:hypothetical protein
MRQVEVLDDRFRDEPDKSFAALLRRFEAERHSLT